MSDKQDELQPIIVKKVKKGGDGHHGGAWKVAYADFVTAMMAFFLLLWLLNVTTKEQKEGIADYFNPSPKISTSESGASGLLGGLSISPEGAQIRDVQTITPVPEQAPTLRQQGEKSLEQVEEEKLREEIRKREETRFQEAEAAIQQAIEESEELQALKDHLMVDMTPEGLRIQIIDQEGEPMFPIGSARMFEKTENLLQKVTKIIMGLPNEVSIRGHTDSNPYGPGATYTNWELSGDRANASRRVMEEAGLPESRVNNIVGKADTDHLFMNDPYDPRNRRISIILLREELTVQEGANMSTRAVKKMDREKRQLYRRTPGAVEFP